MADRVRLRRLNAFNWEHDEHHPRHSKCSANRPRDGDRSLEPHAPGPVSMGLDCGRGFEHCHLAPRCRGRLANDHPGPFPADGVAGAGGHESAFLCVGHTCRCAGGYCRSAPAAAADAVMDAADSRGAGLFDVRGSDDPLAAAAHDRRPRLRRGTQCTGLAGYRSGIGAERGPFQGHRHQQYRDQYLPCRRPRLGWIDRCSRRASGRLRPQRPVIYWGDSSTIRLET